MLKTREHIYSKIIITRKEQVHIEHGEKSKEKKKISLLSNSSLAVVAVYQVASVTDQGQENNQLFVYPKIE